MYADVYEAGLTLLQAALLILLAPGINGIIRRTKAAFQRRRGPTLLQPYWDLLKYLKKDSVISADASWIFTATPYVLFAAVSAAALLVPVFWTGTSLGFSGDAIAFIYLLGLGRVFMLLAAMDTGSVFTGMGSSREASLSALAEPALLMPLMLAGLASHSLQLVDMASAGLAAGGLASLVRLLALAGLVLILVVETGRIPVDNSATHLELTMIHEGLLLEYSGKGFALLTWAMAIKQIALLALVANLFFPWGIATQATPQALAIGVFAFACKVGLLAVAIGVLESSIAKMRLFQVPDLIGASFVFSVLGLISFALLG